MTAIGAFDTNPPERTMPSTPKDSIARAISMLSGISMPLLNPSYMLCFTVMAMPHARAASTASPRHIRMNRMRFSSDPPYSSRRWLV